MLLAAMKGIDGVSVDVVVESRTLTCDMLVLFKRKVCSSALLSPWQLPSFHCRGY